jgi:hypothetical protein
MEQDKINKIANTIVCCPYCKEEFRVSAGWFFADNPSANRIPSKMFETYISKQLTMIDEGLRIGPQPSRPNEER